MANFLRGIAASLPQRPTAVLIVSGHDIGRRVFSDRLMGKAISAYQFG